MDHRVLIVFLWLWSSVVPDDVRLVGGASRCAGILQRRDGGDWREVNVSLSEWNLMSAEEVCRQLDCGSALSFRQPENSSSPESYSSNLQITCSDSVRLVNEAGLCSGRLEVKSGQRWSPVCEEDLDLLGAQVVCRELGCGAPSVFNGGMFGEVEAPFLSKKFQCEGHESALLSCSSSGLTGNTCPPARAVGLTCSDPDDEVRLVGGSSKCSGTLRWKHHGQWRPVDPYYPSWDLEKTAAICRRLDCGSAVLTRWIKESFLRFVWGIDSDCVQFTSTLKECVTSDMLKEYDLEITCSDSVRLVNEADLCSGRLEVKSGQRWSPVCEEDLDLLGAEVVCRELGCGAPSVFKGGMFGEVEAPFLSKKFQCEGHESALLSCSNSGLTGNTCPPARAVGLTCSDPDDKVRLVGGSSKCSGRLEWNHDGQWRPVDSWYRSWNLKDTAVICRRLDCGSAVSTRWINESQRSVWRINPGCVQVKSALKECRTKWDKSSEFGVEITCSDSVRLVNEADLCSGRLEVKSGQRWSPVCEEDLDLLGAEVVCRELGCGAPSVFKGGMFGEVEAPFLSKKFQCEGHESALLSCSNSGLTGNTCPPARAVGLTCSDPDEVRLVGGSSTCSGKLEWKHHGQWRPVDLWNRSWNLKVTNVICGRLDCGSAVSTRELQGSFDRAVWGIDSDCVVFKSTLQECVSKLDKSSKTDLEITCSDSVRLVNEAGLCSGRLEVKSGQRWSPVCEEDLDLLGAQVVCRELGCGAPSVFNGGMFGEVEAPFLSKKFQCEGHESALLSCSNSGLTGNTCPPARAVGLTCSDPDDVRLVGGSSKCSGSLELKNDGQWRPVDLWYPSWNLKVTTLICRRLDCGSAVSTRRIDGSSDRAVWGIDSECVNLKSTFKECAETLNKTSKYGLEITCSDSVRLVNEADLCSGRLEVKSGQQWSPVCEEDLDLPSAQVVCREIGCGAPLFIQGKMFGLWTKDFQSKGDKFSVLDCGGSCPPRKTCSPGKAVELSCANPDLDPDYARLVGEPSQCAGTLEVKHQEEWRPLQQWGSGWDQRSAAVVCKMLKCGSAVSTRVVKNIDEKPSWSISSSCVPTVSSLFQCLWNGVDNSHSGLEVICSDLLEKPNITFSFSTDGASKATPQGYQALIGTSFNITCSVKPQYEGGYFQLIFSDSITTQSYNRESVNHSAHFLFPPANQSHIGQYSCVYRLHVLSHNFYSKSQTLSLTVGAALRDLIIRCVVLLGGLLINNTALYCYYKVKTRQSPRDY